MLKNIRDILSKLALLCRLEAAMVDMLEDHERRLYNLEENLKLKGATVTQNSSDIRALQRAVGAKVTPRE